MFDARLRALVDPALSAIARRLDTSPAAPDHLSLAGAALGVVSGALIAAGHVMPGMAAFLVSRVLDGLDGALARLRGSTDWGAYLDIVCDFIVYVSIPVGFGLSDPAHLPAALLLCASFTLTGVSFLAFAAVAEKRGVTAHERAKKGFLYSRGIAEGGETILAFVLFCLFPSAFPVLATVFAALCLLTAVQRSLLAYAIFHERAERPR